MTPVALIIAEMIVVLLICGLPIYFIGRGKKESDRDYILRLKKCIIRKNNYLASKENTKQERGNKPVNRTYQYEEIFEQIPGDPDHIMLNLIPEVFDSWKEGDRIEVEAKDGALHLKNIDQ